MAPSSTLATTHSTRRLSEVTSHLVIPEGIVTTGWPAVEAQCAEWGDEFDEWQRGLGRVMLGKRATGEYAATVGGITLSIPRQVAKTFIVGRTVFALCAQFPGLKVLWTAHRARTATSAFRALEGYAKRKNVAAHIAPGRRDGMGIRAANGEQEIPFRNGSIIMFGARETGFGRGFDEVDVIVFDEAQILTERALEDMVATTNQSRHPHGALLFYMGTPPRPIDPGEAFTQRRNEALAGEMVDGVYVECSADRGADPDDRAQWAKANPSFPHRTPERSLLRLRKNLPSDESWLREALGIWDDNSITTAIDPTLWNSLWDVNTEQPSPIALGVSMSEDRKWTTIGLAGHRSDGLIHVELVQVGRGSNWVLARLAKMDRKPLGVGVLTSGPAGSLLPSIKGGRPVGAQEYGAMCGRFLDAVNGVSTKGDDDEVVVSEPMIRHSGQPVLNRAVGAARKKISKTGAMTWLEPEGVDCTPLEAVTLALGVLTDGKATPRSGVVMGIR